MHGWKQANVLLFSAVILISGCQTVSERESSALATANTNQKSIADKSASVMPAIEGKSWRVNSIDGQQVPSYSKNFITFSSSGLVQGHAGCNRFMGHYKNVAGKLKVTDIVSSKKICFSAVMYQEHRFLAVLKGASYLQFENNELKLYSVRANQPLSLLPVSVATTE